MHFRLDQEHQLHTSFGSQEVCWHLTMVLLKSLACWLEEFAFIGESTGWEAADLFREASSNTRQSQEAHDLKKAISCWGIPAATESCHFLCSCSAPYWRPLRACSSYLWSTLAFTGLQRFDSCGRAYPMQRARSIPWECWTDERS